jgi:hypothetical protein
MRGATMPLNTIRMLLIVMLVMMSGCGGGKPYYTRAETMWVLRNSCERYKLGVAQGYAEDCASFEDDIKEMQKYCADYKAGKGGSSVPCDELDTYEKKYKNLPTPLPRTVRAPAN